MTAPCVISPGVVIEDFTNFAAWVKDAQIYTMYRHWTCLDDPDTTGLQIMHQNTATPSMGYVSRTTGLAIDLSDMDCVRLDFRAIAPSEILPIFLNLTLTFSSTADFSKAMTSNKVRIPWGMGDLRWTIPKADFTASGGESWSNPMVAMRIGLNLDAATYGAINNVKLYLDKVVKNPKTTALVMLTCSASKTVSTDIIMAALRDYGFLEKAYAGLVDYQSIGSATWNTWAQLKSMSDAGLRFHPNQTGWLLNAPHDAVRPVPPYPAYNAAYDNCTDGTSGDRLSLAQNHAVDAAARAIHDYYGIPERDNVFDPHAAGFTSMQAREFMRVKGFDLALFRSDWTATSKGIQFCSLPLPDIGCFQWYLATALGATNANVLAAIDNITANGGYLNLYFGSAAGTVEWAEADLRAELAYLRAKEDAGLLRVVTPTEFAALAREPVVLPPDPPPPENPSLALALARYLKVQSLVDLVEYGGGNIVLETSATEPDDAYTIVTTGGNMPIGSDHLGYDEPTVSIRVRGTDKLATHGRARAVYGALQGLHDVTLDPGDLAVRLHLCRSLNSEPSYMGVDDRGRYEYVLTFSLHVRAATTNRS